MTFAGLVESNAAAAAAFEEWWRVIGVREVDHVWPLPYPIRDAKDLVHHAYAAGWVARENARGGDTKDPA